MFQGRYEESKANQERAIAISEEVWGKVHDKSAMTRTNLGNALDAMGQHEAALKEHDRAVAIREEALPKEHLHHAWSWLGRGQEPLSARSTRCSEARSRSRAGPLH